MAPLRILHAPADVGGNARGLSQAERDLGFESDVAVFTIGDFGYEADIDLHAGTDQPVWRRIARRALFLREAIDRYDVFHFNFGQTLMGVRQFGRVVDELPLLRRRDKTIIMTYQGCDVRPYASCFCRKPWCPKETAYRQPAADRALRYADRVCFLNPDLGQWLPGATFVPYASVDPRAIEPAPPSDREEIVVAHAPTDRNVKGTQYVIEAIEELRAEGLPVRLDLIEGVTHAEVLARCAAADAVVDQLLIGWYGALAVEAMALARPVLCFIRESENPFGDELPIVRVNPATLVDELRELVGDAARRHDIGLAGRRFVELEHDPRVLARRVLDGLVSLPE